VFGKITFCVFGKISFCVSGKISQKEVQCRIILAEKEVQCKKNVGRERSPVQKNPGREKKSSAENPGREKKSSAENPGREKKSSAMHQSCHNFVNMTNLLCQTSALGSVKSEVSETTAALGSACDATFFKKCGKNSCFFHPVQFCQEVQCHALDFFCILSMRNC